MTFLFDLSSILLEETISISDGVSLRKPSILEGGTNYYCGSWRLKCSRAILPERWLADLGYVNDALISISLRTIIHSFFVHRGDCPDLDTSMITVVMPPGACLSISHLFAGDGAASSARQHTWDTVDRSFSRPENPLG